MMGFVRKGWHSAIQQPFLLVTLFVYRLIWGVVLYEMVQSIVVPLLQRFPGKLISVVQTDLYLAEGQFQLVKTDLSDRYLWLLLGLAVARMLLTPLIQAGTLYSLRHTELNAGYRFIRGVKQLGRPFIGYYLVQMILTLAPLYVLYPMATGPLLRMASYVGMLEHVLPYLLGWLLYAHLVNLLFLHLQCGKLWDHSIGKSLGIAARAAWPIALTSLVIVLLSLTFGGAMLTGSMVWAGFGALLLSQAYRFIEVWFDLWAIAAQHEVHLEKAR